MLLVVLLLLPVAFSQASLAQSGAPTPKEAPQSATARELTATLNQFLDASGRNDVAAFDKFFADDVIYTRSAGVVITKADIMRSVSGPQPASQNTSAYSAEDVTIHEYGETAVVAFRLVARTTHGDGKVDVSNYRNTGIFLRRDGRWQVIAWQSTKVPDASTAK